MVKKWPTHTFVSFSSSQSLANELKNVIKSVTTDILLKVTELIVLLKNIIEQNSDSI